MRFRVYSGALLGRFAMRQILVTVAILTLGTAAHADTMKNCAAAWKEMAPAQKGVMTYKAWDAKCLAKSYVVPANESAIPAGATAKCKDGTYSMSKTTSGRCSHHGGVDRVL
jgi:hypothetical protein